MWQPARPAGEYRRTLQGTRVPHVNAHRDFASRSDRRRRHVVSAPQDGCARDRVRVRGGPARGRAGVRPTGPRGPGRCPPTPSGTGPSAPGTGPRERLRGRADTRGTPPAFRVRASNCGSGRPLSEARGEGRKAPRRPRGVDGRRDEGKRAAQPWSIPTKWPSSASISGAESSSGAVGRTTSSGGLAASSASTSAQVRCSCGTQDSR